MIGLLAVCLAGPVEDLGAQVDVLEARRGELLEAVETRGGFDSGAREVEIFERSLYAALLGEPAEAAMGFHVLLHMGSTDEMLLQDAEWYLAAALQDMGFHELAATRLSAIADAPSHPLRQPALSALVRLRAEHGPPEAFAAIYQRAVEANRIRPTSEMTYTLGKARYDLGDVEEARRILATVAPGSTHAIRAGYLEAVMDLKEGDLERARLQFVGLADAPATLTVEEMARDLAALAVARIHFHRKELDASSDWYGRVASRESVLDESLVENIWNLVSIEDWGATLLAFGYFHHIRPGHADSGRMRLLEGHVLYKMGRDDDAEVVYERVRDLFDSIVVRLDGFPMEDERSVRLLGDLDRWMPGEGLPPRWALEDLVESQGVGKALELRTDVVWLDEQMAVCEQLVREIADALSSNGAIGRFQIYRQEIDSQLDELVQLRVHLLKAEAEALVLSAAISKKRGTALQHRLDDALDALVGLHTARSDRFTKVGELRGDRRAFKAQLAAQEVPATRRMLEAVEAELTDLEDRRRAPPFTAEQLGRVDDLVADLHSLRNTAFQGEAFDALHERLDLQIAEAAGVRRRVDAEEAGARIPIEATLHTEVERLGRLRVELEGTSDEVEDVWDERSAAGLEEVRLAVLDGLMQAEAGLGDVVWNRLLDTRDRKEALAKTQREELAHLETLFRQMRDRAQ